MRKYHVIGRSWQHCLAPPTPPASKNAGTGKVMASTCVGRGAKTHMDGNDDDEEEVGGNEERDATVLRRV